MKELDYSWDDQDPEQMSDLVLGEYDISPDIEEWGHESGRNFESDASNEYLNDSGVIEDPTSDVALQNFQAENLALAFDSILATMHPREAGVVRARMGIGGASQKVPEQISEEFGVSLDRIRQIESKFMSKLRAAHKLGAFKEMFDPNSSE